MKQRTLLRIAWQSIVKNKMRTLLTMLGIVIGVGAVIVMVAVGNGAQSQITASISSLGTNLIVVSPGSAAQGGVSQGAGTFSRLTIGDAEKLKLEGATLAAVSPVISTRQVVIGPAGNWRTSINGVSPDYFTIRDWTATSGDLFVDADIKAARKIAVIGATVAKNLFPGVDAIGAQVQVGHVPFVVSGVLEAKGQNATGADQDDVILVPYTTAQNRLSGNVRLGQILVSSFSPDEIPAAQQEITAIMREAHGLDSGTEDDFTVRNQTEIAKAATSSTAVMSALLAAIASISLLVGGIGIMNIMLVSVTERTREIGIRMAIGARGSDVLTQFLVESVVMSILGGVVGSAPDTPGPCCWRASPAGTRRCRCRRCSSPSVSRRALASSSGTIPRARRRRSTRSKRSDTSEQDLRGVRTRWYFCARCPRGSGNVRDAVDLDAQPVAGKRRHLDSRAGGPVIPEHSLVHGVHFLELRHVDEEDTAAKHVLQVGAGGLQDRLDVLETLFRLRGGIAGDRARRRILPSLTGDEDEALEAHARRVGADGLRQVWGVHGAV
ncbi:MAG: ABC transporter permease [Gemmatimonadaceae bacterium]|jgi:putative ABC transport system permease protein